jgi:mannose-1-phosphate guanylyltransferase
MFIARADVLLGHLREQLPRLHEGLLAIADAWDTPQRLDTLADVWPTLTRISIDHAIAEPVAAAGGMACIPATFGWDDLGDFAALSRQLPDREPQVLGDPAQVAAIEATGLVVTASERTVTLFGVHDLVVVDTPDALLVTTRANAQRVAEARSAWQGVRDDLL